MRLWLKKYWPVLFVVVPFGVLWLGAVVDTAIRYNGIRFSWLMGAMMVFVVGVVASAVIAEERHFARVVLDMLSPRERQTALRLLAKGLDRAYGDNIELQRGDVAVSGGRMPDSDDPDVIARHYACARAREQRHLAARIARAYDDFWGAARLLHFKYQLEMPKKYRDALGTQEADGNTRAV